MIKRISILLLGALISVTCANSITTASVSGGAVTSAGLFPAHVVITSIAGGQPCAGAILNANSILTTGSCVLLANGHLPIATSLTIRIGWLGAYQMFPSNRLYVHPLYNPGTFANDIAVIRLATNILFPIVVNPPIAVANMTNRIVADGTQCQFPGYISLAANSPLMFINTPILNRHICNGAAMHSNRVTATQMCAGQSVVNPSVCLPGRGGGLYCNNQLIGILSNGFGCGTAADTPGIYTQVRFYSDWIQQQLIRTDIPPAGTTPHPSFPIPTGDAVKLSASIFLFGISYLISWL